MFLRRGQTHFLILRRVVDVNHALLADTLEIILKNCHQVFFPVIPHHQVNRAVRSDCLRVRLYIAAHRHDNSLRIRFFCLMEHLAALSVRYVCHRAGVYDIDIRPFLKRHNLIPILAQRLQHGIHFICIHLTAQIMVRYCSHL